MSFVGKVALVTGGAKGVGKSCCTELLKLGMNVCICDVDEIAANLFIENIPHNKENVLFFKCDVSSMTEFRDAFNTTIAKFGKIDIVVNNAGICDEYEWEKVIDVNFIGVIYGIQLAFEYMGIHKGGSGGQVINTASNLGFEPYELAPVYTGCKHGVVGLTKCYGMPYHFEKTGVTVKAVCPGPIDTELFHSFAERSLDPELAKKYNSKLELVSPDEVAKAMVQLLLDDKNGALLSVDATGRKYV